MNGRHLAIGLLGALALAVGIVFWLGVSGGGTGAAQPVTPSPRAAAGDGGTSP